MPTRDAAAFAVLTVLLLFVAVNLQAGWVYAVDALLIGFAVAGWLSALLAVRPLPVRRVLPAEVFEGERVTVRLSVGAARWPRFFLRLRDAIPGLGPGEVFVPSVWRRIGVTYATVAGRRGVHRVEGVDLQSEGITGLFRMRRRLACPGAITVFPRYAVLTAFPLPGRRGLEASPQPQPSRSGVDVAGVRDFRDGDDPARIHWRSTARRGHLVVREFEREVEPAAALVIDTRPGAVDPEGFEALVRAAASVAHYISRQGQPVRVVAEGSRGPIASTAGWVETLRLLATLQCDGRRTPSELCGLLPPGTPVVAFTGDADALTPLAAGGIPLVAVLAGPAHAALLLEVLGIPVRVLRPGEEVGACLDS